MRGMGCALSIHKKHVEKVWGARYLPENTDLILILVLVECRWIRDNDG
jgi:hypothetical protein